LAGDFNGFSPVDRERYDSDRQLHEFFAMLDRRDTAKNLNEGRIDYGGIEAILKLGFVDTFAHDNQQNKPFKGTFPTRLVADEDHGTERRLDYIFVSNNLRGSFSHSKVIRTPVTESLSDHIPVSTILSLSVPRVFTGPPQLLQEHGAGEGPAWHPQLGLLTSGEGNINLRSLSGESNRYREQAGSNGLMFDRQGRLIVCEPVRRRVTREELDGSITVLAETFSGMRFNQPNDLTIDSQNRIYFTDPQYGDRSKMELVDDEGRVVEGVYRIDPNGNVTRIITHEVDRPNGIVITPDDAHLFVADNNNAAGGARKLWRFNLNQDGTVDPTTQRLIYDWGTTRGPDGMKLDQSGNLYVAGGLNRPNIPHETAEPATAGIYVFNNKGLLIEFVPIPRDETTNCGFGGHDWKTLFVTAGGSLWAIPTLHPGRNLFPLAPQN
jgi:gluconolactonase